jgi:hypothetical protein
VSFLSRFRLTKPKTIEILSSVENDQRESAVKTAQSLQQVVQAAQPMPQPPRGFLG